MIFIENKTNIDINTNILEKIAKYLTISKDIELIITDDSDIKSINKEYRGVDKSTDVLSFPLQDLEFMPLGSIVISIDSAKKAANEYNHSLDSEISLLFTHGVLHLLGYDHEIDNGEMRKKEQEIVEYFNLPKSLIVRVMGE